jgi:hypothetical protein
VSASNHGFIADCCGLWFAKPGRGGHVVQQKNGVLRFAVSASGALLRQASDYIECTPCLLGCSIDGCSNCSMSVANSTLTSDDWSNAVTVGLAFNSSIRSYSGWASCACVSQRDSIGLHNEGGRMGEFCLLYLLCMLPFPVPLTSSHRTISWVQQVNLCYLPTCKQKQIGAPQMQAQTTANMCATAKPPSHSRTLNP